MTGIEPALSAWEADVLPLNYTRKTTVRDRTISTARSGYQIRMPPWAWVWGRGSRDDTVGCVLLSDKDLRAEIASGRVRIEPYDDAMVQPSSIDVRLDRYFRVFENHRYPHIDPAEEQPELTRLVEPEKGEPFILHPGEFVLGSTYETVSLPDDLAGRLEGKSSLGRLGLLTHSTAGFIDPGFSGHVTLELSNVATLPIKLWPGMKIGQLCIFRLSSPAEPPVRLGRCRARAIRGSGGRRLLART